MQTEALKYFSLHKDTTSSWSIFIQIEMCILWCFSVVFYKNSFECALPS